MKERDPGERAAEQWRREGRIGGSPCSAGRKSAVKQKQIAMTPNERCGLVLY